MTSTMNGECGYEELRRDKKAQKRIEKCVEAMLDAGDESEDARQRLTAVCRQYAESLELNKRITGCLRKLEQRIEVMAKDKITLEAENRKALLTRTRLEGLCRELQKQNRHVKEESIAKIREEEERRREASGKFQTALSEINSMMSDNDQKNTKLTEENKQMSFKLKQLCDQYEHNSTLVEKMMKQKELESHLAEARLVKLQREMVEEKKLFLQEKQTLLQEMSAYQKRCTDLQGSEVVLRQQLTLYTDKYDQFQAALAKSNKVFSDFKSEMDKMQKNMTRVEREAMLWKQRFEGSSSSLAAITADKRSLEARLLAQNRRVDTLQSLCRALQHRRAGTDPAEDATSDLISLTDGSCGTEPASSSPVTCTAPSSSDADTCTAPSSSDADTCTAPSSSEAGTCPAPSSSGADTCPAPSSSGADTCPAPSSSGADTCPTPSSSDADTCPAPSSSEASTCPAPSSSDADTCPAPSSSDADTCPAPSSSDADTCPAPSSSDADTCPAPSSSEASTCPTPSSSDADTCPTPSSSDNDTCHAPSPFIGLPAPSLTDADTCPDLSPSVTSSAPSSSDTDICHVMSPRETETYSAPPPTDSGTHLAAPPRGADTRSAPSSTAAGRCSSSSSDTVTVAAVDASDDTEESSCRTSAARDDSESSFQSCQTSAARYDSDASSSASSGEYSDSRPAAAALVNGTAAAGVVSGTADVHTA